MNLFGSIGCGGGAIPPFLLISSCDKVGGVHSGISRTSPNRTSGL